LRLYGSGRLHPLAQVFSWSAAYSKLAHSAVLGMSAHGAGTAKAHEIGREEGTVARLVMVLVELANVIVAPALAFCLQQFQCGR
jgi:putative effector of murein hydrolase